MSIFADTVHSKPSIGFSGGPTSHRTGSPRTRRRSHSRAAPVGNGRGCSGIRTTMTKAEFVEMLTFMVKRSRTDEIMAARVPEEVGAIDASEWASLLHPINGKLYLDDSDDVPTREGGMSSTPLYELNKIDEWPDGLFEKLSGYIWWIDPEDEINLLDVIAAEVGIDKRRELP